MSDDTPSAATGLQRHAAFCEHDHSHAVGYDLSVGGEVYWGHDVDALLAAKDAESLSARLQLLALNNYISILLDRLTGGHISTPPIPDLVTVEAEVDEAFTKNFRQRIAELEPLAKIGRLAVEEHKAYLAFLDAGTDDQVANDALVVAQEAVDVAITSYRAAQAEGKEGE